MHDTMFVGLDVHKATISVAVAVASAARDGEARYWGSIANRAVMSGSWTRSSRPRPGNCTSATRPGLAATVSTGS